jgi:hypothetical protein
MVNPQELILLSLSGLNLVALSTAGGGHGMKPRNFIMVSSRRCSDTACS